MKSAASQRVVLIGASDKPERYAHLAMVMLREHGHEVLLVRPRLKMIEGLPVLADLTEISGEVDVVTLYVGPAISAGLTQKLINLKPKRVIFNPGTESSELEAALNAAGIPTEEACTLVLLRTGQF
ncbi:MAG: CoA-binding protein [Verrucomicrobia bacterium]|nr:CoA-binding protein [Verrucomicrobiota bacterium]